MVGAVIVDAAAVAREMEEDVEMLLLKAGERGGLGVRGRRWAMVEGEVLTDLNG